MRQPAACGMNSIASRPSTAHDSLPLDLPLLGPPLSICAPSTCSRRIHRPREPRCRGRQGHRIHCPGEPRHQGGQGRRIDGCTAMGRAGMEGRATVDP
ncbi:hypothetical protein E2562_011743 [Oryza meyeriana var. granulata]|uniref:Uncharacterized protein n=1 Tax=Oryza meyeriana var. granulata TaxID=110450 RepID=A0A6G1DGW6_9ORYZ|nr:hypothetical protein E2562_011743 [Oryza meyeriana var. granulata]